MYRHLDSTTTIRLLDIHPGYDDEDVVCSIGHCSLSKQPVYEAVSYVWGQSVLSDRTTCNGQQVYVTPNLHDVLKRVRLESEKRTIWIDGLCINQLDSDEKSRQVHFMYRIYQNATRILVWLGPDPDEVASRAFKLCHEISREIQASRNEQNTESGQSEVSDSNAWSITSRVSFSDTEWRAMVSASIQQQYKPSSYCSKKVGLFVVDIWYRSFSVHGGLVSGSYKR
jgi:hypothetical protein